MMSLGTLGGERGQIITLGCGSMSNSQTFVLFSPARSRNTGCSLKISSDRSVSVYFKALQSFWKFQAYFFKFFSFSISRMIWEQLRTKKNYTHSCKFIKISSFFLPTNWILGFPFIYENDIMHHLLPSISFIFFLLRSRVRHFISFAMKKWRLSSVSKQKEMTLMDWKANYILMTKD